MMPNVLQNNITFNRISMIIHEFLSNDITIKTTTNLSENNESHFLFDILPVYNLPNEKDEGDVIINNKYIRLVPVNRSIIFKRPTSERLDSITISFLIDNKKIEFPIDEYKCNLKLGPHFKNKIEFPLNHNLQLNDEFEIVDNKISDDFINNIKYNSYFTEYKPNSEDIKINPLDINNNNKLKLYNPNNNQEFITFLPTYESYKTLLNNKYKVDHIIDNSNINFTIDSQFYLLNNLSNNETHTYLLQSLINSINDYNEYKNVYNKYVKNNIEIYNNIEINNKLIKQAKNIFDTSLNEISSLKSCIDEYDINNNIKISNNEIYINEVKTNKINLYIGNKYKFNQSDNSNINKNNADNIINKKSVIIKKIDNNNKKYISINDILNQEYNFIQNAKYNIDLNDNTLYNTSIVLIPSDSLNIIERLNINNVYINTQINEINNEYFTPSFIYPIELYIKKNPKNTGFELKNYNDFYNNQKYYLRQYGSHNIYNGGVITNTTEFENNNFEIIIPAVSFNDTVYEMPFEKYRGYNFDYEVTGYIENTNNTITIQPEKRDAIVDIGISPFNIYNNIDSGLQPINISIDDNINNNPTILNNIIYKSFDGLTLYSNTLTNDKTHINNIPYYEIRPLPCKNINPYIALKWKYIYKFDFNDVISTNSNIKYVILELNNKEGIFDAQFKKTFGYYLSDPGIDPTEMPIIDHIEYIINDNNKSYFKIDITQYSILYIDLRELISNNTNNNIIPSTYEKKYLFGKTLKLYYGTNNELYNNNYAIIKLGSLLKVNSYYFNYFIENYNNDNPTIDSSELYYNKFSFKPYTYNLELYIEPNSYNKTKHYYKIFNENNNIILYQLKKNELPNIIYEKVNITSIYINIGDIIILDCNHHSLNNYKFNIDLSLTNNLNINSESNILYPQMVLDNESNNKYISQNILNNNNKDLSSSNYNLINDIFYNNEYIIDTNIDVFITCSKVNN